MKKAWYSRRMVTIKGGYVIALEGADGCGKSHVAHEVTRRLTDRGFLAVPTRQPWGSGFGRDLRQGLADGSLDPLAPRAMELAIRDREAHDTGFVQPASNLGAVVVCERFLATTVVYNTGLPVSEGLDWYLAECTRLKCHNASALPDLAVYLRVTPEVSAFRSARRPSRESVETVETAERVIPRYDALLISGGPLARDCECEVVDASAPLQDVVSAVLSAIMRRLPNEAQHPAS